MKFPVLWLSFVSWYSKGDIARMGLWVPFVYQLALLCKSCRKKNRKAYWQHSWLLQSTILICISSCVAHSGLCLTLCLLYLTKNVNNLLPVKSHSCNNYCKLQRMNRLQVFHSLPISSLVMMVISLHLNQSQKRYPCPDILVITS